MEIKPSDALKEIIDGSSIQEFAQMLMEVGGKEWATVLQGQLAIKIIEAK